MNEDTKARFVAAWEAGEQIEKLAEIFGTTQSIIRCWRYRLKLEMRSKERPVPAEFVAFVSQPGILMHDVTAHFKCSHRTATRWFEETGAQRNRYGQQPKAPKPARAKATKGWRGRPQAFAIAAPRDEAATAAHYLRRFYPNVFRCDIELVPGKTWGQARGLPDKGRGLYTVAGVGIMPEREMVALAERNGFGR